MTAPSAGLPVELIAFPAARTASLPPAALRPARGAAPMRASPPEVRWALLLGELMQVRDWLPPPPARRIGDPSPGPQPDALPPWLESAKGHFAGLLSRGCEVEGPGAGDGLAEAELEARLMIVAADHLLAERLDWAGRPWWDRDLLARAILGRPALDTPTRTALQARLAAGDPTFTPIVPVLLALGLGDRLFPTPQERALCARSLSVPPASAAPALPIPPAGPAPEDPAGRRRGRARVVALGVALAAPAILLLWQAYLWHDLLARLGALLAAG